MSSCHIQPVIHCHKNSNMHKITHWQAIKQLSCHEDKFLYFNELEKAKTGKDKVLTAKTQSTQEASAWKSTYCDEDIMGRKDTGVAALRSR